MVKKSLSDSMIDNGFRQNGFNLEIDYGRVCQLHLHKGEAIFRSIKKDLIGLKEFWVPARSVLTPGKRFYFDERLRTLQWKKNTDIGGSIIEIGLSALYALTNRHQTGVMLQTWLNPSPTLHALFKIDFDNPFTIFYVDDRAAFVEIYWYNQLWKLELTAFSFPDLFWVEDN